MSNEELLIQRVTAEITAETGNLDKIRQDLAAFRAAYTEMNPFLIRALGSLVADFYSGVERVLKIIAEELDGGLPKSENWHKQLLINANLAIAERPPVLSGRTVTALLPYLGFRHVFRNAYGFELDYDRMKQLEQRLPETLELFANDIHSFCAWLKQ